MHAVTSLTGELINHTDEKVDSNLEVDTSKSQKDKNEEADFEAQIEQPIESGAHLVTGNETQKSEESFIS